MDQLVRSKRLPQLTVLAFATILFVLTASVAMAALPEPTMGLSDLQTRLDASPTGTLQGYLKTVLRGSTVETIPVEVLAITGSNQESLILFEASGPKIEKIGGIAAGMSGSPLYIDDGGVDTLVGALSYGGAFTLGGTGLATPIESMMALEIAYPMAVPMILSAPVLTDSGWKDRVILTQDPESFEAASRTGALVAAPLSSVFVGGIDPRSSMFKSYSARMKTVGLNVVPLVSALGVSKDSFETTFVPGASVAALATRGDLWLGGIGTVTRTSGDSLLAFGHPAFWAGDTSLYLSNAWIDGVWGSSLMPYKIGRPGMTRGTVTQDRSAGILGQVGVMTKESTITAHAENVDTGASVDTAVYIPRTIIDSPSWAYNGLAPFAAYVAGSRLVDASGFSGSALTTTTVVVDDGTSQHTIVRANIVDDSDFLDEAVTVDVAEMVSTFQTVNGNGLSHADIVSVTLESEMTSTRRTARIVDMKVPGGLRRGDNRVTVSLLQHGVIATRTVDVTLTIPADVPLTGELVCTGPGEDSGPDAGDASGRPEGDSGGPSAPAPTSDFDRLTVQSAIDLLNSVPTNNQLTVSFTPSLPDLGLEGFEGPLPTFGSIEATMLADCVVTGYKAKSTPTMDTFVRTRTVPYGGTGLVEGKITGVVNSGIVKVYGSFEGTATTERLLADVDMQVAENTGFFSASLGSLKTNAKLRFVYEGDTDSLACEVTESINVAARVSLKSSNTRPARGTAVTLTASTLPTTTTGKVTFERYYGGRWVALATRALASGSARLPYKPPVGSTRIRVRYLGGPVNVAGTSSIVTLIVK